MLTHHELTHKLADLPLGEREQILSMLEKSMANEHQNLAAQLQTEHVTICNERLARYDAGKSEAQPFDQMMGDAFGNT